MKRYKYFIILIFSILIIQSNAQKYPFEQAKLPYSYQALEPVVDAMTMEIHFSKHHATYVKNLNAAVKGTEFESWTLNELMLYSSETSDAIRNNAGGHFNHELFWNVLSLQHPFDAQSAVGKAILTTFGSPDTLKKMLVQTGLKQFGSGWVWLIVTPDRKLVVCSTPNQDNPIMDISRRRGIPVLAIDVWEHAYYLKYQNKRVDYLTAITGAINWEAVNRNYTGALSDPLLKTIELETWQALNEFHQVMAETFHPSEKGNLTPVRNRSGEMAEKAQALLDQPIPASFNTVEIKKSITDLLVGAKELDVMVKSHADDKMITGKLNNLHDLFHSIQGQCRH